MPAIKYMQKIKWKTKNICRNISNGPQNGFRSGRSCIDPIFSLNLLFEKKREFNLETHFLFLDCEKAFDQANRLKLFNILQKRNIPDPLFTAIFKIYEHNEIRIKFNSKLSKSLAINRGVRQGCPLSPT
jgi:hypothetical protein